MNDPMNRPSCNVCSSVLGPPVYESADNASITTMNKVIAGRTRVYFCDQCAHLQTSELPDLARYYAEEYAINLASDEDDQLYKVIDGKPVYRAQHQAETVLAKVALQPGQRVLDYGCAKAPTLRRIAARVPGLVPMTFDVTDKYTDFWDGFVASADQAVGTPRADWQGKVDVVLSFYALEHVADPGVALAAVHALLRPGGTFYFIVPNVYANIADFVVADHVNHFSDASLRALLARSGFRTVSVDDNAHDAAWVVVAERVPGNPDPHPPVKTAGIDAARSLCVEMGRFWADAAQRVRAFEAGCSGDASLAIYGAGFYGNFIASSMAAPDRIACFVDQNQHLQGRTLLGRPVLAPAQLPATVTALLVGLNPRAAHQIIADIPALNARPLEMFFL
jgi:SAM-dependent methyltransferase